MEIGTTLKQVAKAGFLIISRLILFTAIGLIINAIILLFLSPEIMLLWKPASPAGGVPHAGYFSAILVLGAALLVNWPVTLLVLTFAIGFPLAYFILGKKHGIKLALFSIIKDNKGFATEYIVHHLFEWIKNSTSLKTQMEKSGLSSVIHEVLPTYLKKLNNMPKPARIIFRHLVKKVDYKGLIERTIEEEKITNFDSAILVKGISKEVDAVIDEHFLEVSLKWFWILLLVNISVFTLLKFMI